MKKYHLILSFCLLLLSCKNERFSNVKIETGEYNHNLFDGPKFIELPNALLYRPIFRDGKYQIDSVPNGERKLTIFSLLTKDIERIINLQSDTLIVFDNKVYPSFTKVEDSMLINVKTFDDTVFVGRNNTGCFHHFSEKLVLFKTDNKLRVEYYSTEPYQIGYQNMQTQLIDKDTLFTLYYKKFVNDCKQLYKEPFENHNFSTTSLTTYIRKGKFYYELPDIEGWKGFDEFKANLGIKPLFARNDSQQGVWRHGGFTNKSSSIYHCSATYQSDE